MELINIKYSVTPKCFKCAAENLQQRSNVVNGKSSKKHSSRIREERRTRILFYRN